MNEPKRHHYIPQMLLKQFADSKGMLWTYCKSLPNRGIIHTKPVNAFVEKDLYAQYDAHGNKDYSSEKDLAKLEGRAAPIIAEIVRKARIGKSFQMMPSEKEIWDDFFYRQWIRVPQIRVRVEIDNLFFKTVDEAERKFRLTARARGRIVEQKEKFISNAFAKIAGRHGLGDGEAMGLLRKMGLAAAVIRNPRKSWIIGSFPIMKLTPDGHTRLGDPRVETLLPISYDVMVTPHSTVLPGKVEVIGEYDSKHIRDLNMNMYKQSNWIAGRSEALVRSLVGMKNRMGKKETR